jgi:hypothetical protein
LPRKKLQASWGAGSQPASGFSSRSSACYVALVLFLFTLACGPSSPPAEKLHGRWLRPDGGYILEIQNTRPDGTMTAGYFNPNPIRVEKAEWEEKDGALNVMIVLSDANYPGSMYVLRYVPEQNALAGQYFQAAMRETFDVVFTRAPAQ